MAEKLSSTINQAVSHSSINSLANDKYGGLIQRSFSKKIRNLLIVLISYVYQVSPVFAIAHNITSFFRIFQLIGPSFCGKYPQLWIPNTSDQKIISIVSIFYQLIPIKNQNSETVIIFLICYNSFFFLFLTIVLLSALYFQKKANLPALVTELISFFLATFAHVLHPIAISFIGCLISEMIMNKRSKSGNIMISNIVVIVVVVVVTVIITSFLVYLVIGISGNTLTFRPNSLLALSNKTSAFQFFETILTSFLLGIGTAFSGVAEYFILILASIVYFSSVYLSFFHGGFISNYIQNALIATNITSGICVLINFIFRMLDRPMTNLILFGYVVIWIISFLASTILMKRRANKYLMILDEMLENSNSDFHQKIPNPNFFLNILKIGFEHAHPICVNLSLCRSAVDFWPKAAEVWYGFAKFIAIYPEETQILEWIFLTVTSSRLKGSYVQIIKNECLTITRQRESTLSQELKIKINKLTKQTNSSKHKLRHVWDAVLQGNINEIEEATKKVANAIEQNNVDFQRLLRQFPNNRFVTRPYARFIVELVGDATKASDMLEKTRLLQRGINVNTDQIYLFGLNAFHNLPSVLKMSSILQQQQQQQTNGQTTESMMTSSSFDMETEMENVNNTNAENLASLKERIESVKIPAIRYSLLIRYSILFVVYLIPFVVMLVVCDIFFKSLLEPLLHLERLATLETNGIQTIAFTTKYIFSKLNILDSEISIHSSSSSSSSSSNSSLESTIVDKQPPEHLGNTWDIKEQLKFIVGKTADNLQSIAYFRSYQSADPLIAQAQKFVFTNVLEYMIYTSPSTPTLSMSSIQGSLVDVVLQSSAVLAETNITESVINKSYVLNLVKNSDMIIDKIVETLDIIIDFLLSIRDRYKKVVLIVEIVVTILVVIVNVSFLYIQIRMIKINKENSYMCLTSLPKNVVSQLAENLRVLKKDNNSTSTSENGELSKQEENILKIYNTGGSSGIRLGDILILVISTFLIGALEIASTFLLCKDINSITNLVTRSSPQLHYVQAAYSYQLNALHLTNLIAIQSSNLTIPILDIDQILTSQKTRNQNYRKYYRRVRFGSPDYPPIETFISGRVSSRNQVNCTYDARTDSMSYFNSLRCNDGDFLMSSMSVFIDYLTIPYEKYNEKVDPHNELLSSLWSLSISPCYNTFLFPLYSTIVDTITNSIGVEESKYYIIVILMMLLALFIEIVATFRILGIQHHIRFVLKLLLHCNSDIILSIPKIVSVLNGDFSSFAFNFTNRDIEFYDSVFANLPESILFCDSMLNVEHANKQCCKLLGTPNEYKASSPSINSEEEGDYHLIGKHISQVLSVFEGNYEPLLKPFQLTSFQQQGSNQTNEKIQVRLVLRKSDNDLIHLVVTSFMNNSRLIVILKDITSSVRYNTLIKEERNKSDSLLSTILPQSLVPRVQAGEKNICFAVQSVSIVFMDIVSFTPWCGSLPADKVMSTLNNLFKKFDSIANKYSTMTKIKCIGDCYMAAGGVFAEVNQPIVHAKEVVCFGLDSIEAVKTLNKEVDQSLQIRVGINTGGPIVAGVLGIGKPTFEILGPTINMAQQMEHHGVPMMVHISRTVYEMIYGDTFVIKERGAIEVKNGSVITYLVLGMK